MAHVMTSTALTVRAAQVDDEIRLANALMADAYGNGTPSRAAWLESSGRREAERDREHTRIALAGNDMAGTVRITTETLRIGEARLKVGGLAWAAVSPRHHRKGVELALFRDAHSYLRANGYHLSMVFANNEFLRKFDYAKTCEEFAYDLEVADPPVSVNRNLRVRRVKPGDIASLQRLFQSNYKSVDCTLLRTRAHFSCKWSQFAQARVLTDARGKVVAYVLPRRDSDSLCIDEVGVESLALAGDVCNLAASVARENYLSRVSFLIPPAHTFSPVLSAKCESRGSIAPGEKSGMMAFMDIGEALESIIPEWENLVARSPLRSERCELSLVVGERCYRIRANRSAVDVSDSAGTNKFSLTAREFMQLITGFLTPEEIYHARRRMLAPDGRLLLKVLFPNRNAYVPRFDRF